MNRYDIGKQLGEGAFGNVFLATKRSTGKLVAIKRMKDPFRTWDDVVTMRELTSLRKLPIHDNIVELFEIHCDKQVVHLVFEYMSGGSLHDFLKARYVNKQGPLPESDLRPLIHQILLGTQHLHKHGIYHRDLKPENILLHNHTAKVADFSMARLIQEDKAVTSYVSTRWYRAPEVLLCGNYSSPVDLFAIGCIAAEMYALVPIFPGRDEFDQVLKIFKVMGKPQFEEGQRLVQRAFPYVKDWPSPKHPPRHLLQSFLNQHAAAPASAKLLDWLLKLLDLDPIQRLTADLALHHAYFDSSITLESLSPWMPVPTISFPTTDTNVVTASPGRLKKKHPVVRNPYRYVRRRPVFHSGKQCVLHPCVSK